MRTCKMPRLNRANVRWLAAAGVIGVLATTGVADPGLIWDASGVNPTSPTDGAGTWDTSLLNWSNVTSDVAWPNDTTIAIYGDDNGAAGFVNLTSPLQAGGLSQ